MEEKSPIRRILDKAYELLGNPIAMIDTSYHLLEHTENPVKDDPLWNELLEFRKFSHETVDFFIKAGFVQAYANSDVVSLLKSETLKYDRVCGKLFDQNDVQWGSIAVVACCRPFQTDDYQKIADVCEWIREGNSKNDSNQLTEQFSAPDWIIGLIEGKIQSQSDISTDIYKNFKMNLFVAVVDVVQYENTISHLAYFRDYFLALRPDFYCFIYLNNVVIIFSSDNPRLSEKDDLKEMLDFFNRYNIYAGLSDGFQNIYNIQKYYKQAVYALNEGLGQPSGQKIFRYESYRTDYIINFLQDIIDLTEICNPVIFQIIEYDKSNGLDYFKLLYAYLLNGKNIPLTCGQIDMSPDTLQKCLDDIENRFEINWTDGNQLSSLLLSIRMINRMRKP